VDGARRHEGPDGAGQLVDPEGLLGGFAAACPDPLAVLDPNGCIEALNLPLRRVLAPAGRDVLGRGFAAVLHPADAEPAAAAIDRVRAGAEILDLTTRWPGLRADVPARRITWSLVRRDDHIYASGRVVTDRADRRNGRGRGTVRAAERPAAGAREAQLERELLAERERTDELELVDRRKDTFLSAVTHELRTPLALIQGMAETLQRLRSSLPTEEITVLEDALVTNASRLSRLVAELLDLDRLGRGKLTMVRTSVDVRALVAEAIAASTVAGRTTLVAPDRLTILADEVQVETIVTNLLVNVAKYAPEGQVVVTLGVEDGLLRLAVRDRGPGIPDDALERVFEPFWRVDEAGSPPGTGVGLALVSEFARLHGGGAWAEPATPGAHLVVELPVT
jgi:signal transduction histidine kinase